MLYRNVFVLALACTLGTAGCRDNGPVSPVDLSMGGGGGGGGGGGTGSTDMAMASYIPATVAMMRGGAPGLYELDNVIAIALTPSTKSPKLVVQDATGGDFSAIQLTCSGSSTTHPCTVASTVHTVTLTHSVTVKGTYIKDKLASGGGEQFYIDSITDNGPGTAPAPLVRDQTALERATMTTPSGWNKDFWQKVTVTPTEALVMYDWTPSDLKFSGTWPGCTTAPYVFGFGMIPTSAAATATAACTVKTAPAPSQATSDGKEILIGTDYYKDFAVSSDCQCAKAPTMVPSATTTWPMGMAITGILGYDTPQGGSMGYKFFSPTEAGVLTNLVAPPM